MEIDISARHKHSSISVFQREFSGATDSNQEIVRQLLMGKMGKKSQPSTSPPIPYPQSPPSMPPPSMPPPIPNVAFGNKSQHMICPHCHANISTRIESESNTKTHLNAILLCMCGCCCCAPCAYCMDSCRVKKHYCPGCGSYLGQSKN